MQEDFQQQDGVGGVESKLRKKIFTVPAESVIRSSILKPFWDLPESWIYVPATSAVQEDAALLVSQRSFTHSSPSLHTHPSADGRFRAKSLRPSSTRSTPTSSHQAHRSSPHHIHHLHQRWGFPISTMGPNHKDSYFSSSEHKGDKYLYVQDRRRGRRFCLNLRK